MLNYIAIFVGGGLGSLLRYSISLGVKKEITAFPLATFLANMLACVLLGYFIGMQLRQPLSSAWYPLLATGFCGGFSTFSTFSAENFQLLQQGNLGMVLLNIVGSIVLGLFAVWIGIKLGNGG